MLEFIKLWLELKTDRRAVTAIEYGLIAALVAVALVTVLGTLKSSLSSTFNTVATTL